MVSAPISRLMRLVATTALALTPTTLANDDLVLPDVALRTVDDGPTTVPQFGKLPLVVFYTDADVSDLNDPLADALTASPIEKSLFEGIGVVNLKDSKAPNFVIRSVAKDEMKKYDTIIVTDPDGSLAAKWALGDCNNTSVVVVIGADRRRKYVYKGAVRGAEIERVVALVGELVKDSR